VLTRPLFSAQQSAFPLCPLFKLFLTTRELDVPFVFLAHVPSGASLLKLSEWPLHQQSCAPSSGLAGPRPGDLSDGTAVGVYCTPVCLHCLLRSPPRPACRDLPRLPSSPRATALAGIDAATGLPALPTQADIRAAPTRWLGPLATSNWVIPGRSASRVGRGQGGGKGRQKTVEPSGQSV